jgi:hypothetical protein
MLTNTFYAETVGFELYPSHRKPALAAQLPRKINGFG